MGSKRNIPSMLPKNIMAVCIEIQHPLHKHMFTVFVLFFLLTFKMNVSQSLLDEFLCQKVPIC